MNIQNALLVIAAGLLVTVPFQARAGTEEDMKAMEAAAERIKKSADDFRAELRRIREERARTLTQHAIERKREADERAEQDRKDAIALAAAQREGEQKARELRVAQEKARREALLRAERAEQQRQAVLDMQREMEDRIAHAQAMR